MHFLEGAMKLKTSKSSDKLSASGKRVVESVEGAGEQGG